MTWLPLTAAQRGLYFAHRLAPQNPCYTTAEVVEFPSTSDGGVALDPERLAAAVRAAHRDFEQVRTEFVLDSQGPLQRVVERTVAVPVQDVDGPARAEAWMRAELDRPMVLEEGDVVRSALLRLPDGRLWWFHAAHHVVLDGYGVQQLLRRVAEHYDAAVAGVPAPDQPHVSLADLVAADAGDAPLREAQAQWWAPRLDAMEGSASIAGRSAAPAARAEKASLVLAPGVVEAVAVGARALGVAWSDLVVTAIGTYLARVLGRDTVRVGLPQMNRSRPGVGVLPAGLTVCTAMNVLPVTVPAAGRSVKEAVAATAAEQAEVREHSLVRQEELARALERRSGAQLFGAQVNLVPFDLEVALHGEAGAVVGLVRNLTAGPVEDMTICLRGTPRRGRTVRLEIDANPDLHEATDVAAHLRRLARFLAAFAGAGADTALEAIPLADEDDLAAIETFNATSHARATMTLGARFAAQVASTPDATALRFRGEERTYADLAAQASTIAAMLSARGIGAGDVVGLCLQRGFALYEAVHALALLGAVYLPLDPDLPAERVAMMLEDAAVALVVVEGATDLLPDDVAFLDLAGREPAAAAHLPPEPRHDDVDATAYLLFTSGSTGRPKGVLVSHRAIDNRLAWMQDACRLEPGERVLHKTPISFDVSVWELYWPLQVGACVVIAEPGAHRDPRALAEVVVSEQVSTLHFVPSMLRAFLADPVSAAAVQGGTVRTLVTSGEALTPDLVAGSLDAFGVAPLNLYGPTEAAVDVTAWQATVTDDEVPIGRPIWNTTCHVLDAAQRPVPVGVPGELWLGGVQLAQGYVGRPDLTSERFVPDPFSPLAGARMYRTGDLAAWRADGALRYLGRTDDQVKVRGQRLELGEVEAALAGVPGAFAACAGVLEGQLVVWFQPAEGADPAEVSRALREVAAQRLPASMLPSHWIPVGDVPLGASGKTDRKALAARHPLPTTAEVGPAQAPEDLATQLVAQAFADVLAHPGVAADDDFFDLGGDSLSVLRLLGAVEEATGHRLELSDVFASPTVRGVAAALGRAAAGEPRSELGEVLTLRRAPSGVTRAPVFLLPPAGGLGWCYLQMLRHLPADLAVHTIQAPGLEHGAPEPVADLVALASRQLAAIRSVVGEGAFHVAGWSLGGMAAHTVAALARAQGQSVGAVVLLDAYPSEQWQHLAEPSEAEALVGILRLAGVPDALAAGSEVTRTSVLEAVRASGSALASLPDAVLEGCLASVVEAARIVRTSQHPVLSGDVDVVVAGAERPEHWLSAATWKSHTVGEVREHPVTAGHGDLVRRPVVAEVSAILTAAVLRAEGER